LDGTEGDEVFVGLAVLVWWFTVRT
jgi:hypothetical protein